MKNKMDGDGGDEDTSAILKQLEDDPSAPSTAADDYDWWEHNEAFDSKSD